MRRPVKTVLVLVMLLFVVGTGTAWAHPGDATEVGFENSFAQTAGEGFDIPAPNGQGLFNTKFTEADVFGGHPVSNSLIRNPVCTLHRFLHTLEG